MRYSRRQIIGTVAAAAAGTLVDPGRVLARLAADVRCADPGSLGTLIDTLPLFRGRSIPQAFGAKYGARGLDARLVTDLSLLQPDRLITPNDLAFIRTERPAAAAAYEGPWTIEASGLVASPKKVTLDGLAKASRPMGPHLFECRSEERRVGKECRL